MPDDTPQGSGVLITVLFADISGSTLMYAQRGDTVAFNITSACLRLMDEQVTGAGGRVVKTVGDAVLATFETSEAALRAAIGIQETLDRPGSELRREGIHVRIGLSRGRAVQSQGDVFGDVVNVAARIESHAGPDEILLSGPAYDDLPALLRSAGRQIEQIVLRNRPEPIAIYQYLWKQEDATLMSAARRLQPTGSTLSLTYGAQQFVVDAIHPQLKLGRAADNEIVVEHDLVSRYHAEITLRGDKFFLADSSTNGTFVNPDGSEPFRLAREAVMLNGSGQIVAGSQDGPPISYHVSAKG